MVDKFEAQSNRFLVVKDDAIAFDTDAPSFSLFDTGRLQFTADVTFPDLLSNLYYYSEEFTSGGITNTYCESWSSLMPQEWGPDEPDVSPGVSSTDSIQRNLARYSIGTVPAGTNHLNIRVRLRRTKTPPVFYYYQAPSLFFGEDTWINLSGGSCPCEGLGTRMKRHFDIVLDGTTLYLERYQSVNNQGVPFTATSTGNTRGWITNQPAAGGTMGAYANAPAGMGFPMVLLDKKGFDTSGSKRAPWATSPATNSCAIGADLDYESVYNVDFDIQPGRYL